MTILLGFCDLKVEIFLEQREVAFLSPSKILLDDKNATYLCSRIISTLSETVFSF
jgi:hypothetical protein